MNQSSGSNCWLLLSESSLVCTVCLMSISCNAQQDLEKLQLSKLEMMASKKIFCDSTMLLCVDVQTCYYKSPVTELFPKLEQNVSKVLAFCRESEIKVTHIRQEDVRGVSDWLEWWEELHPEQVDDLGVPAPLPCAEELEGEPLFIKNTFDGFFRTGLDKYLRCSSVQ